MRMTVEIKWAAVTGASGYRISWSTGESEERALYLPKDTLALSLNVEIPPGKPVHFMMQPYDAAANLSQTKKTVATAYVAG